MAADDAAGTVTRSLREITRILEVVRAAGTPVEAYLADGDFRCVLLAVERSARRLVLSPTAPAHMADKVRERSYVSLHTEAEGWHIEFTVSHPRARGSAIEVDFPAVLARHAPRVEPRVRPAGTMPLRCVADASGIASFDASVLDVSERGVGFIVYPGGISLEPGTVLKGCEVEIGGIGTVALDLEVRYSEPVQMPDGRKATRSGCRIINAAPEILDLVRRTLKGDAQG